MKPSLEQLKESREVRRNSMVWHDAQANVARRELEQMDAQIAEEEREAKAKEWPQEGDDCWLPGSFANETHAPYYGGEDTGSWVHLVVELGIAQKTQDDAAIVHRFLRSRPRGWLLAMAKLGQATPGSD